MDSDFPCRIDTEWSPIGRYCLELPTEAEIQRFISMQTSYAEELARRVEAESQNIRCEIMPLGSPAEVQDWLNRIWSGILEVQAAEARIAAEAKQRTETGE